jgi:23S rRNA (cytosine1962-C5)-methyltransferase
VPLSSPPQLRLAKDVAASIRRGHPWVFAAALERARGEAPPAGAEVDVADARGAFLARGYFDPDGPIAVRVLTRDAAVRVDDALVRARVASACALRVSARAAGGLDGDALRLLHGEADGLPGLVLDAYADNGVLRCDGAAAAAAWEPHARAIADACGAAGFPLARVWARTPEGRRGDGRALLGDAPPVPIVVREAGMQLEVDVVRGQKTGLFLDQRPNRALVGRLAAGARVLNLFAYTGGFSLAAALGGATRVTTVDLARPAIDAARRNFTRSGVDPAPHEFVAADCREFLAGARRESRAWDLVVCDPPSFAPSERARPAALHAYRELNAASLAVVAPGGLLATASCSSHVTEADLRAVVAEAATEVGRDAVVVYAGGAGPDHPVAPAFPEGRYLKFLLLRVA